MFDTAAVGIVELDRQARVTDANAAFLRLGGWSAPEVAGRFAGLLAVRADVEAHRPLWADLVAGRCGRYSVLTTLRGGRQATTHVVMTAVRDGDGATVGAVAVVLPVATGPAERLPAGLIEAPTAAEIAVLRGLASGLTLQQLAGRLGLTRRGVDYRLARLRHKLRAGESGPATTAGVVARGYALGLLQPDTWPPAPRAG